MFIFIHLFKKLHKNKTHLKFEIGRGPKHIIKKVLCFKIDLSFSFSLSIFSWLFDEIVGSLNTEY